MVQRTDVSQAIYARNVEDLMPALVGLNIPAADQERLKVAREEASAILARMKKDKKFRPDVDPITTFRNQLHEVFRRVSGGERPPMSKPPKKGTELGVT